MTIEWKLLLGALAMLVGLIWLGEPVNEFLHGEDNWRTLIEDTPYYDYNRSQKETPTCIMLHCP